MRLNPPLKWAGGKRWLIPHLMPLWEKYRGDTLIEPLCGGLAVALRLMPQRAVLNDINPHVINFYRWLQRGLTTTLPMRNDAALYYRHRRRFNRLITIGKGDNQRAAELFYYLNRSGYNGLCRFNSQGGFNVPFGRYAHINYTTDFSAYRDVLRGWTFITGDFERVPLEDGAFVYADPPYDVEFTHYFKEPFRWDNQVRLAEWLARHRGVVVLSNQATRRIVRLYAALGFTLQFLEAPRMISCTGNRTPAKEVLAIKGL